MVITSVQNKANSLLSCFFCRCRYWHRCRPQWLMEYYSTRACGIQRVGSSPYPASASGKNSFIKNNHKMLLDPVDFILQKGPEDAFTGHNCRAWSNAWLRSNLSFMSVLKFQIIYIYPRGN